MRHLHDASLPDHNESFIETSLSGKLRSDLGFLKLDFARHPEKYVACALVPILLAVIVWLN